MPPVHIVALTPDLRHALVVQTAAGWLLPCSEADTRSSLISTIGAVLTKLSPSAQLVHWAPVPPAAVHGRAAMDSTNQRYCVALVREPFLSHSVVDTPVEALLSARAMLPLQREALKTAVSRARAPQQCFDSANQVTAALDWAIREMAARADARPIATLPYRCARNDYVVGFDTTAGLMYFKAGRRRTTDEASLCDLLRAVAPRQFPTTLSVDRHNDRWLYRALGGELLSESVLTTARIVDVIEALTDVQKRTMRESAIKAHLAPRSVRARDVLAQVDEIVNRIWHDADADDDTTNPIEEWQRFLEAGKLLCARIDALDLPMGLALSDFWTANIIISQGDVGFIDVENAYWTYPFVPLWRFVRDVDRQLRSGGVVRELIEQTFVEAWADVVSPRVMWRALADFPVLGQLFGVLMANRDLDRFEEDLGTPLPASYRAAQLRARVMALIAAPELG